MKKLIYIFSLLLITTSAFASKVSFQTKLSHTVVEVGQRFQITFEVNQRGSNFNPPNLSDFRRLSGPNPSSMTNIMNGQVSYNMSYSYILMAEKVGKYTIDGAKITVDGKTYSSNSVEIEVVQGNASSANAQRQRQQQRTNTGNELSEYVFLRAFVDKKSAYVGEKITVTYRLYTQLRLSNPQMEAMPALSGFWHQELRSIFKDNIEFQQEVIDGKVFNVADIQQNVLYPQRSGDLTVDALKLKFLATVQKRRSRSIYEQMFGSYERKEVITASDPIKINVKPLPKANQPANFSGAVGRFDMELSTNKNLLKTNEAIDVKLTIRGQGNLPLIGAPELNFPPDFEVYDPETENKFQTNYNGSQGSKEFKYLVIPRTAGSFELEPYSFSYFDLQTKSYKTLKSEALRIEVAKGEGGEAMVYNSNRKKDVEMINSDIRYIHTSEIDLKRRDQLFYNSPLFYLSWIGFIILSVVLWFVSKLKRAREKDQSGLRKSKANKVAKKRLSKAKKHIDSGAEQESYEAISEALFGYYADKFDLTVAELSQEKIIEVLESKSASPELINRLKEVLQQTEMARFAPSSAVAANQLYQSAIEIIGQTENMKA